MDKRNSTSIDIVKDINQGGGNMMPKETLQKMREILAESIAKTIVAKSISDLQKGTATSAAVAS